MKSKKYEFTGEIKNDAGRMLHRIRALTNFGTVKAGDLGGWIEKEENLSQDGNCWVYGDAIVYDISREVALSRASLTTEEDVCSCLE